MAEISVMRGRVKWFNPTKGYGFISRSDGKGDVFVHHNDIEMDGFRKLDEGQEVEFEVERTAKGLKAVNVVPL